AEREQQQRRPHAAAAPAAPPAARRHGSALGPVLAVGLRRHASGLLAGLCHAAPWFKARPWSIASVWPNARPWSLASVWPNARPWSLAAVWPNARSWSLSMPLFDGTVGGAVEILLEQDLRRGRVDALGVAPRIDAGGAQARRRLDAGQRLVDEGERQRRPRRQARPD